MSDFSVQSSAKKVQTSIPTDMGYNGWYQLKVDENNDGKIDKVEIYLCQTSSGWIKNTDGSSTHGYIRKPDLTGTYYDSDNNGIFEECTRKNMVSKDDPFSPGAYEEYEHIMFDNATGDIMAYQSFDNYPGCARMGENEELIGFDRCSSTVLFSENKAIATCFDMTEEGEIYSYQDTYEVKEDGSVYENGEFLYSCMSSDHVPIANLYGMNSTEEIAGYTEISATALSNWENYDDNKKTEETSVETTPKASTETTTTEDAEKEGWFKKMFSKISDLFKKN